MARYISIDVDSHGLIAVSATVGRESVAVERLIANTELTQPLTLANADQIGERLKQLLKDAKASPAPALVVVGRDRILLKEIKHPPVPPSDEPGVIRFQALKEVADGADDVAFDYLPLPATPNTDEKRAAVAFVKKDVVAAVRRMCDAAGLKLAAITPRPFAIVAALQQATAQGVAPAPDPADAAVAVVLAHEAGGEFTVCRGGLATFTRSLSAAALVSEQAFIAELRRNLAVASGQAGSDVQAIYVAEAETRGEGWSGRLRAALGLPVYAFDPLATATSAGEAIPPELHGRFLGAMGLLAARLAPALPINFAQPRQPRRGAEDAKKSSRTLIAAGLGALAFLVLLVVGYLVVDGAESRVANLRKNIADVEELTKAQQVAVDRLTAADEYDRRGVNWLDEYYEQTVRFPDIKKVRMTHFDGKVSPLPTVKEREAAKAKKGVPKKAATLTMTLVTDNGALPADLYSSITKENKFYMEATLAAGAAAGGTAKNTGQQYTIVTGVAHRTPAEYATKLIASFPKAPPPEPVKEPKKEALPDVPFDDEGEGSRP